MSFLEPRQNGHSHLRGFFRFFVFFIILAGLPFSLFWGCLFFLEKSDQAQKIRTTSQELSQIMGNYRQRATLVSRFESVIQNLSKNLSAGENILLPLKLLPQRNLKFFLFDQKGLRIDFNGLSKEMKITSQRFLSLLIDLKEGKARLSRTTRTLGEGFVGSLGAVPLLANRQGRMVDFRFVGLNKIGGWYNLDINGHGKGFLLVVIDIRGMTVKEVLPSVYEALSRKLPKTFGVGWINLAKPDEVSISWNSKITDALKNFLTKERIHREFLRGSNIWNVVTLQGGYRIFGWARVSNVAGTYGATRVFIVVLFISWGIILAWLWWTGRVEDFSIRTKLLVIFGSGGFIGVSALIIFANTYGQIRVEAFVQQNQRTSQKILEKVDSNFFPSFAYLLKRYQNTIEKIENDKENYRQYLDELCGQTKNNLLYMALLVTENGDILFQGNGVNTPGVRRWLQGEYGKSVANLGKQILSIYNYQSSIAVEANFQEDSVLQKLLTKPSENILRRRGGLQYIRLGGEQTLNFVDIIHDSSHRGWGVLLIIHDSMAMEVEFLNEITKEIPKNSPNQFSAIPKTEDFGLPAFPAELFQTYQEDLSYLSAEVQQTGNVRHRLGNIHGNKMLLTGLPGRNISDFQLFLFSPFGPIQAKSENIKRGFNRLGIGIFVFTLLLGYFLANGLLTPIGILLKGIEDLLSGDYDHPLELKSVDDLGQISEGINRVMSDLKDRTKAKAVEEQLLPAQPIRMEGFFCHGWLKNSEDFGGKIFDQFVRQDRYAVIFMADFSGFGISSALLNAMAKMACRLFLDTFAESPKLVIGKIFRHFSEQLKNIKDPSILLGWYDSQENNLTYSRSGNIQGIFLPSPKTSCEYHELISVKDRWDENDQACDLSKGGRILFCSTGRKKEKNEIFGPGLSTILGELQEVSVERWGAEFFEKLSQKKAAENLDLDQVIMLLEKSRDGETAPI